MKKDTFLNFLKTLPIKSRKTNEGFRIVYDNRAWELGMVEIEPKPSQKELDEAIEWLKENKLALPYQIKHKAKMEYLVKIK